MCAVPLARACGQRVWQTPNGGGRRRTGCCARRPPSSRRSIGTVTSGRAAVASPSSSASAASSHRPSAIGSPDPRFVKRTKIGDGRRPPGLFQGIARAPSAAPHRMPAMEFAMEWAVAGASRSVGAAHRRLGGSVCSRRCAPRPLAAAARAEHRANNTNFSSNFNSARRRQGLPDPSRARRPQRGRENNVPRRRCRNDVDLFLACRLVLAQRISLFVLRQLNGDRKPWGRPLGEHQLQALRPDDQHLDRL